MLIARQGSSTLGRNGSCQSVSATRWADRLGLEVAVSADEIRPGNRSGGRGSHVLVSTNGLLNGRDIHEAGCLVRSIFPGLNAYKQHSDEQQDDRYDDG